MGQNSGVLLKEVAAIWRCPLIDVSLYSFISVCIQYVLTVCTVRK